MHRSELTYTGNPRVPDLRLDRLNVGQSVTLDVEQVPNIQSFRVNVSNWAKRHGVTLSVHVDPREGTIEIGRTVAGDRSAEPPEVHASTPRLAQGESIESKARAALTPERQAEIMAQIDREIEEEDRRAGR